VITDDRLEQLLRDEFERFPGPRADLTWLPPGSNVGAPTAGGQGHPDALHGSDDQPQLEIIGYERPTPRRARRAILVAAALLAPLAAAVLVLVARDPKPPPSPAQKPPPVTTPAATAILGAWLLEGTDLNADRPVAPVIEFRRDGTWTGSDGCNAVGGTWRLDRSEVFSATSDPQTLIGCGNVPYSILLANADSVEVTAARLFLRDSDGRRAWVLRRPPTGPPPDAPTAGWLPGFSSFTPERRVRDPELLARFEAVRLEWDWMLKRRDASWPLSAWYLGRVHGIDEYLVPFGPDAICTIGFVAASGRGAGGGCTSRASLSDPLRASGGSGLLVADAVASVVAVRRNGERHAFTIHDNYAAGEFDFSPLRTIVTLDDGRSRILGTSGLPALPSQSSGDAARDRVAPNVASMAFGRRVRRIEPVVDGASVRAEVREGVWMISASRYEPLPREILLLSRDEGTIIRAFPLDPTPPQWLLVTDRAVYCGREGDGAIPDSMLCRIDRRTGELLVHVFRCDASCDGLRPEDIEDRAGRWTFSVRPAHAAFTHARLEGDRLVVSNANGSQTLRVDAATLEPIDAAG
jgi:META domain